jgi:signal transduction histidine kinase
MNTEIRYLKLFYLAFLLGITIIFLFSWSWNYSRSKHTSLEYAKIEASASYNKDLLYRRWASMHGGVYVPISSHTPPNPNLLFIADREITTNHGKQYTLVNPAYMTRQVHEIAESQYGVKGHITSLKPLRIENKPDKWEWEALNKFETGIGEVFSIEKIDSTEYLRYMKPMITESSCLKCHAHQHYKLGDVRGGISVSVPMSKYHEVLKSEIKDLSISHILIYLATIIVSFWFYKRLMREMKNRNEIQEKLLLSERMLLLQNKEYILLNEDYKHQNRELLAAKIKAEESDYLKTSFIQNISHEIRTPMNSIVGFSELIDDPELTVEKRSRFIQIIVHSTKQLLSIVNNILTISSIEKKQEEYVSELVCLNKLLDELCLVFKQKALKQGVELKSTAPLNDNESEVWTDSTKLTQVLTNLIANALKFTQEGLVEFGYSLKKDELEFFVKDTGIGIHPDKLEIIFERFRQADITIGKKFGGNGLGLSISKGFVELLGGRIWVESEPGKGSIFRFTIPYRRKEMKE